MRYYDISRLLQDSLAPWPGDTSFNFRLTAQLGQGAVVNVGAISMGLHNGTHADAPFHYVTDGEFIDALPLELFIGSALVVDVSQAGWLIGREHLFHVERHFATVPRLLLKTGGWPDSKRFPEKIPTLAPDVPAWLAAAGVRLLALDVPSVDTIDSKTLPVHLALAAANIYIIESLDLSQVPEGIYELIALPLKIAGATLHRSVPSCAKNPRKVIRLVSSEVLRRSFCPLPEMELESRKLNKIRLPDYCD